MAASEPGLFLSRNPRVRALAQARGIFQYAQTRLRGGPWSRFIATLNLLGLPASAEALGDHQDPDVAGRSIIELIWGLSQPVDDSTVGDFDIYLAQSSGADSWTTTLARITGLVTTTADVNTQVLRVDGTGQMNTLAGTGGMNVEGGLRSGVAASALNEPGVAKAQTDVITPSVMFRDILTSSEAAQEPSSDIGSARCVLFRNPMESVEAFKAGGTALSDQRVILGKPQFDTGWIEIVSHVPGDPDTNPPYEITFPLGVVLPNAPVGDAGGVVRSRVWLRSAHPGLRQNHFSHAILAEATNNPGSYSGVTGWFNENGQVHIRVSPVSGSFSATMVVFEVRLLAWMRGGR